MLPADEAPTIGPIDQPAGGGSTVARIILGARLRRLRQANEISREDAGYAIRGSHTKISRMELGQVRFKMRDIDDLLTLYGVHDPQERDTVVALAECANAPSWWQQYEDVLPDWFELYLGLEDGARVIRTYALQFVPGLLQTEDYARAVIGLTAKSDTDAERRVALRMRRQRRLTGPQPLRLWAVVDEAALRRPFGTPEVLRAQLAHLRQMAERPTVTLQIVPFANGGHPAADGPFSILRFAEQQLPDITYLEHLHSACYLDKPDDTDRYMEMMERLCVQASPPEATLDLLTALQRDLG